MRKVFSVSVLEGKTHNLMMLSEPRGQFIVPPDTRHLILGEG
jgi:hypothetical protein